MAAAVATITALRDEGAIDAMHQAGTVLRDGITGQAAAWGIEVNYTGPAAMPYLTFAGDADHSSAACSPPRPSGGAPTCIRGTTGSSPRP